MFVTSSQVLTLLRLQVGTSAGSGDLGRSYPLKNSPNAPEVTPGGAKVYSVVTDQIFFKIGPGRFPSIFIVAPSSGVASVTPNCFITGTLSDDWTAQFLARRPLKPAGPSSLPPQPPGGASSAVAGRALCGCGGGNRGTDVRPDFERGNQQLAIVGREDRS